jgi:hypothetical protein
MKKVHLFFIAGFCMSSVVLNAQSNADKKEKQLNKDQAQVVETKKDPLEGDVDGNIEMKEHLKKYPTKNKLITNPTLVQQREKEKAEKEKQEKETKKDN